MDSDVPPEAAKKCPPTTEPKESVVQARRAQAGTGQRLVLGHCLHPRHGEETVVAKSEVLPPQEKEKPCESGSGPGPRPRQSVSTPCST